MIVPFSSVISRKPFIKMDSELTVSLCDQWFDADYNVIVDAIHKYQAFNENELSFSFINKVLEMQKQRIQDEYM